MDRKTEKMLDRIAISDFGIRGHVDLQITNPLTGKPYYKFEDHNMVMDGLYTYLKTLCIIALSSYNGGPYSYRPLTSMAGYSGIRYPYESRPASRSFSDYITDSAPSGNANLPPSNNNGSRLNCPIDQIVITDSLVSPSANDVSVDGNIIAMADSRTAVSSGSAYGVFSYARCIESFSKLYRRWDWASANGNGVLSKIMLCQTTPILHQFDMSSSVASTESDITSRGVDAIIGEYAIKSSYTNSIFSISVYKIDLNTPSIKMIGTIEFSNTGLTSTVTGRQYSIIPISGTTAVIIPNSVSDINKLHVYKVDLSTCEILSAREMYGTSSATSTSTVSLGYSTSDNTNNPSAYMNSSGDIIVITYQYTYKVPDTGDKLEYIAYNNNSNRFTDIRSWLYSYAYTNNKSICSMVEFGDTIRFVSGSTYYTINTTAPSFSTKDLHEHTLTYNKFYDGNAIIFLGFSESIFNPDSPYRIVGISGVANAPYIQVDKVISPDLLKVMTARLLPEPITKQDMPMYVGYTLKFE